MVLKFSGIRRKTEFSPNHVTNDLLIANLTARELTRLGGEVTMYNEGEINPDLITSELLFSMAQGPDGIRHLMLVEQRGALIINSPRSVQNCYRVNMVNLLPQKGIPFPKSIIVQTSPQMDRLPVEIADHKLWIKRGDVHAVHKEDVTLVYNAEEALTTLEEFHQRGIRQAILQQHLDGDTVKFYAVRESSFYHWYYLNGVHRTPFDADRLRAMAAESAETLGLYVYGGDAIIGQDGSMTIIDINDWPSFAPVREEASRHIAQLIYRKATEYVRD